MEKKKDNNNNLQHSTNILDNGNNMIAKHKSYKSILIDGKQIKIHRYKMEEKLGRKLKYDEVVHHIDENKLNNDISNLKLMSRKEHNILHHRGKKYHGVKRNYIEKTFKNEQKTLFGDVKIKPKFKLNNNQFKLLSLFALNDLTKFTRNNLFYITSKPIHINTISNFLKDSESKGFIKRQRIIPGATINNLFMFQKLPDTFEDGSICKDIRAIYYSVTKLGIEVFNLNEKLSLL